MRALVIALAMFATYNLGSAENVFSKVTAGPCYHTPDNDWTNSANTFLRKIPETMRMGYLDDSWLSMFSLENPQLAGLGSLWYYKPPYVFCANNNTFIEVTVFAEDPLRISVDWRSCTSSNGTLGSTVSATNLRLLFSVQPTTNGPVQIRLHTVKPDNLEDPTLFVTGASDGMSKFVRAISNVGMPYLELGWKSYLRDNMKSLIDRHAA
uniref:Putative conserved secreted protein n=1 Tax=Rhipicephalus microplus TaxID=6941 RepID=A0A6G5A736_RHIMP